MLPPLTVSAIVVAALRLPPVTDPLVPLTALFSPPPIAPYWAPEPPSQVALLPCVAAAHTVLPQPPATAAHGSRASFAKPPPMAAPSEPAKFWAPPVTLAKRPASVLDVSVHVACGAIVPRPAMFAQPP